jgi:ABC-type multidrug transport system permease subunit
LRNALALTAARLRLVLRNRAFLFFSVVMPMAYLVLAKELFARGLGPTIVPYLLASVMGLTIMGTLWGMSLQLVMFREQGILRRFRLAPLGAGPLLLSSVLANYILMLPVIALQFAIARWVFQMTNWGNLWGVLVMVTLGVATFGSLGLIIASVTNSMQETQLINNSVWFLLLFFAGATVPLPVLPGWIQDFALFLPGTYLVTGFQRVMIDHASVWSLGEKVLSLVSCALVAFFLSKQIFRWDPDDKLPRQAKLWGAATLIPFLLVGVYELRFGHLRGEALHDMQSLERQAQFQQQR